MKKTLTVIAAALLLSTSSFASDTKKVDEKIAAAFAKDFKNASNVNWEDKGDYYLAEFKVGSSNFNAAYNADGELLAASRVITIDMLPLAVTQSLNAKYSGYKFAENVTELSHEGATSYYITIANEKQVLYLKANTSGSIQVESKTKTATSKK